MNNLPPLYQIPAPEVRELDPDEAEHVLHEFFGIGMSYRERRLKLLRELREEVRILEDMPISHRPTIPSQFDPIANSRPMPAEVPDFEIDPASAPEVWRLP